MPSERPFNIGFNPDFAPFAFEDRGAPRGLVVDRAATAFRRSGIPFVFSPLPLPEMMTSLYAGRVDALAGIASIAERRTRLAFSRPVMMTGGAWFSLKGGGWPDDGELHEAHAPPCGTTLLLHQHPELRLVLCYTCHQVSVEP